MLICQGRKNNGNFKLEEPTKQRKGQFIQTSLTLFDRDHFTVGKNSIPQTGSTIV